MKHIWIAALVLSGACASPPAPGMAAAEKKICRDEPKLGSLMPVKVCETQAYWDELEERRSAGVKDAERHIDARSNTNMRSNDRPL